MLVREGGLFERLLLLALDLGISLTPGIAAGSSPAVVSSHDRPISSQTSKRHFVLALEPAIAAKAPAKRCHDLVVFRTLTI